MLKEIETPLRAPTSTMGLTEVLCPLCLMEKPGLTAMGFGRHPGRWGPAGSPHVIAIPSLALRGAQVACKREVEG